MTASIGPPTDADRKFDPEAYLKAIDTTDFLRLVVSGHLYIEAVLIELIKKRLPSPSAIELEELRFMQIVDLAVALDLLKAGERQPFRLLNKMRNKLAHELGAIVTMGDVEDFLKAMAPEQLRLIQGITGKPIRYGIDLQPASLVLFVDLHSRLSRISQEEK